MPATLEVKLEGMTELVAAMRRLPLAVRGQALEMAVRSGAELVAATAASRAQGAFRQRSGKLLRAADSMGPSMIQVLARSPEYVLIQVWPRLPYTHLVEGGHRLLARGPGRKGAIRGSAKAVQLRRALLGRRKAGALGQVAARPFLGPAYEATKEAAAQTILNTLWRQVDAAWQGA